MTLGARCRHERRTHHTNQVGEVIAWSCDQCAATGAYSTPVSAVRPRSNLPETVPQLPACDWCAEPLLPRPARNAFERWLFKRYCNRACYEEDLEDRRETGRVITCPDTLRRGFRINNGQTREG